MKYDDDNKFVVETIYVVAYYDERRVANNGSVIYIYIYSLQQTSKVCFSYQT